MLDNYRIQGIIDKYNIMGASISLINSSKVTKRFHFGVRCSEKKIPIDEQTIFEVGSISKPIFSIMAISCMKNMGLTLEIPLVKLYPYSYSKWDIDCNEQTFNKITASMILSHTSGFNNWDNWDESPLRRLKFSPGSCFSYSGEGYIYLQKVVEHLSGKCLNDYFHHNFLLKLGFKNSSFIWKPSMEENYAKGHGERNNGVGSKWLEPFSAFSLYSTIEDLENLMCNIVQNSNDNANLYKDMLIPHVDVSEICSWGLGWGIEKANNTFWHWGNLGDYQCFIAGSQLNKDGIIILTNSGNGKQVFYDLILAILGREIKCSHHKFLDKMENKSAS